MNSFYIKSSIMRYVTFLRCGTFLQVLFVLVMIMGVPVKSRAQFGNEATSDYTVIIDGPFELSGDNPEHAINFFIPPDVVLNSHEQSPILTFKLDGTRGSRLTIEVLINDRRPPVSRFTIKGDTFQTLHEVVNQEGHFNRGFAGLNQIIFSVVPGRSSRRPPPGGFGVRPRRSLFISDVILWYQRD